jgi:hypothetical protein
MQIETEMKEDLTHIYPPMRKSVYPVWSALYRLKGGGCWNVTWGHFGGPAIKSDTALALAKEYLRKTRKVCLLKTVQHGTAAANGW